MSKGFQHNQIFKIVSMKDKTVIEAISGSASNSNNPPVVAKKWSNAQSQKFKALLVRPGEFRLSSLLDESMSLAWDCEPSDRLLFQSAWENRPFQTWFAEEIHPNSKICVIRPNADSQMCLRNMGVGNQISLVEENLGDVNQHWKLESKY
ncbi:uncharacterized protein LOC110852587 [Folsomia candida]|uniref:uncharacterized protein LOC110852587 n=1 Tax=Folsomia candida TaxID=158441 RepID=UPI000B8F6E23|nr:uncharacterized protein LOC110852587 [Folsomia candida]XP_021956381.1 uncharacterized protein LOC110852587 [Folsomia candida]XP_035709441.1 uncharacterized protein LOC110852587 [Folsomia candida]